jgi:Holliday junction resolvase RusA-like endonuclease
MIIFNSHFMFDDWISGRSIKTIAPEEIAFQCFIPGVPPTTTASQEMMPIRAGKRTLIVQSAKGKKVRSKLAQYFAARRKTEGIPFPLEVSHILYFTYVFPHKKGTRKKDLEKFLWYENTPDTDNLAKNLKDALTIAQIIKDDRYTAFEVGGRLRGPDEYVGIHVKVAIPSFLQ